MPFVQSKPTVDQMDLEILYSQYIRSLYLNTMFQHSFQKREEEAMVSRIIYFKNNSNDLSIWISIKIVHYFRF